MLAFSANWKKGTEGTMGTEENKKEDVIRDVAGQITGSRHWGLGNNYQFYTKYRKWTLEQKNYVDSIKSIL